MKQLMYMEILSKQGKNIAMILTWISMIYTSNLSSKLGLALKTGSSNDFLLGHSWKNRDK